ANDEVVPALGDALYELGRFDEAANVVAGALRRADDELAIATLAANLHRSELWGLNDADRALATLRDARDRLTVRVLQDVLRAAEANVLAFSNRPREAIEVLDTIGRIAPPASTIGGVAGAAALAQLGQTAEAVATAEKCLAEHRASPEAQTMAHA